MRSIRYRKKTNKRSYKKKQTHKLSYRKKQTNKRSYKKKQTNKRKTHKRNNKRNKLKHKNLKQFGGGWDGKSIPKKGDMASALLVEADGETAIYGRDLINCSVLEVNIPGKEITVKLGPMKIDGMSRKFMIKTYTFDEAYKIMRPYSEREKPPDWRMQFNPGEVFMDRRDKGDPFEAALERRKSPKASVSDKKEPFHNTLPPKQGSLLGVEGTAGAERSSMRSSSGGSTDSSEGSSAGGSISSSAGGSMSSSADDDGVEQVLTGGRKKINDKLAQLLESEDKEAISMALRKYAGGSPLPAWSELQERLKLLLERDGVDEGRREEVGSEDIEAISMALRSDLGESQMQQQWDPKITVHRIPESRSGGGMTRSVTPREKKQSPRQRGLEYDADMRGAGSPRPTTGPMTPREKKQSPRERGIEYDEERRKRNLRDQATWKTVQRRLEREQGEMGGQGISPSGLSDTGDLFEDPHYSERRKAAARVRSYRGKQGQSTEVADPSSTKSPPDLRREYDEIRREREAAEKEAEAAAKRLRPQTPKPLQRTEGYSRERQGRLSPGRRSYQNLRPQREEGGISGREGYLRLTSGVRPPY